KFSLDYTLEAYFYDDASDVPEGERAADEDNYLGHVFVFDGQYSLAERFTLMLNDSFYYTRRPVESDEFSNSIARDKYWVNRFTPGIFYDFNERFSTGLRYRRTDIEYVDDESQQSNFLEHRILFNFIYNPTRTLTFDLDYQRWTNTEEPRNLEKREYTSDQLQLVLEKRFTYIALEGGIGFHNRSYEDDPDLEDQDSIIYKAAITWQNPPPEDITQYRGRSFIRAKTHAYLAAEKNFNNLGYYFDTYVANRLTGSIGYVFLEKFHLFARGYYQITEYKNYEGLTPEGTTEIREDKVYDYSAGLGYLIRKNMEISIRTGNKKQDSNIAGLDYENNYAMLTFDFNYDLSARGDFSEEASYYR
ncbi:MAG: outer membrane beta-barrel protein, partial [Thermodesulfobacteriota bacterium]